MTRRNIIPLRQLRGAETRPGSWFMKLYLHVNALATANQPSDSSSFVCLLKSTLNRLRGLQFYMAYKESPILQPFCNLVLFFQNIHLLCQQVKNTEGKIWPPKKNSFPLFFTARTLAFALFSGFLDCQLKSWAGWVSFCDTQSPKTTTQSPQKIFPFYVLFCPRNNDRSLLE